MQYVKLDFALMQKDWKWFQEMSFQVLKQSQPHSSQWLYTEKKCQIYFE